MSSASSRAPVVVTGGAGAIGAPLVLSLLRDGHEVRVLDNLSSGRRDALSEALGHGKLALHVVDLRHAKAVEGLFEGVESVWHLAANPDIRLGTRDPTVDLEHGTISTFNVLEASRRAGVKRFLFSSSSVVYGLPTVFPTPESYGPLLPQSLYGASKLACEGLVSAYTHSYGLQGFVFRFANIIGPGMTHGVIVDFFDKLKKDPTQLEVLGDGRQSKSYLRVDDCVAAMRLAEARAREPVNVFNLGTRDRASVKEIAEKVVAACGGGAKIRYTGGDRGWPGDIPQQLLDVEKITELGFKPQHTSMGAVDVSISEFAKARGH